MKPTAASKHVEKKHLSVKHHRMPGLIISGIFFVVFTIWFLVQSHVLFIHPPELHLTDWKIYLESGKISNVSNSQDTDSGRASGSADSKLQHHTSNEDDKKVEPQDAKSEGVSDSSSQSDESGKATEERKEKERTRLIRTLLMYFFVLLGILIVRVLYENTDGEFFSNIVGILAAVILSGELLNLVLKYFINDAYGTIIERVPFALSLVSFGFLIYYVIGFYPMSTRILLKSMRRKLLFDESKDIDWVTDGCSNYPVDVVSLDSIPQDIEHINGAHLKDMNQALRVFVRKASASRDSSRLILIGGFGAGKSTALLNIVQRKLTGFLHAGNVPVYVKLRDWLKNDQQLADIMDDGANTLHKKNHDDYMDELIGKVAAVGKNNQSSQAMKEAFIKLHENRRLVYVYDGLNELVQRKNDGDNDMKNQQRIRNIMSFLYRFAGGNPCIVSTCDLRNVITTRSVMLGDQNQYQVYAVKGVHVDKDRFDSLSTPENAWKKKLLPHVALYRLAELSESDGNKTQKTIYSLLNKYVYGQLCSELIDESEVEKCINAIHKAIKVNMEGSKSFSAFLHSPYIGLQVDEKDKELHDLFRHMGNTRLFYTEEKNNEDSEAPETGFNISSSSGETSERRTGPEPEKPKKAMKIPKLLKQAPISAAAPEKRLNAEPVQEPEKPKVTQIFYHPSHILIYEYMLADYIKSELASNKILAKYFFCGEDKQQSLPDILELPHLRSVFIMIIEQLMTSGKDGANNAKEYCKAIYDWICSSKDTSNPDRSKDIIILDFFLMLSEINNDLHKLNQSGIEDWFALNNANSNNDKFDLSSFIADNSKVPVPVSLKVPLLKLLPPEQVKKRISIVSKDLLEKEWTHISPQRELLLYAATLSQPSEGEQSEKPEKP